MNSLKLGLLLLLVLLSLGCQTSDAIKQATEPALNTTTEKAQPYAQEVDQRVAGAIRALANDTEPPKK